MKNHCRAGLNCTPKRAQKEHQPPGVKVLLNDLARCSGRERIPACGEIGPVIDFAIAASVAGIKLKPLTRPLHQNLRRRDGHERVGRGHLIDA